MTGSKEEDEGVLLLQPVSTQHTQSRSEKKEGYYII